MEKKQKRIMILGGNFVQAYATAAAKAQGYYVISTDLHEDNPGHKIADEYCKVDIIDREAVLREARRLQIDGIVPYCSDTLAPIAAYVIEQMQLPGNPYSVIHTMTHKDLFRQVMSQHGFLTPHSECVTSLDEALETLKKFSGAVMMKPTDSSGSHGVCKVMCPEDIKKQWDNTLSFSQSKTVILEDYIERTEKQQDGDIFVADGKVVFWGLGDQYHRPEAPFMIAAHCYPSTLPVVLQQKARDEVQRLITALGYKQGPCNLEYIVDAQQRIWILDIGPRNGGNMIPIFLQKTTGVDLTTLTVRQAVGDELDMPAPQQLCCAMSELVREGEKTVDLELTYDDKPLHPAFKTIE